MKFKDNYLFFRKLTSDVLQVIFPLFCPACNSTLQKTELLICCKCRHELPVITIQQYNFHYIKKNKNINIINVLFKYELNSAVQQLIHNFKYKNPEKLGKTIANWQTNLIKKELNEQQIDVVIPVPMHFKKLKNRGYNQINSYAKTLANNLNAKYLPKVLIKIKETKTQSKQSRNERFKNIHNSIKLNPEIDINNLHILLVDDVITTGATMEACIESLKPTKGIKISIAAIAIAFTQDL